MPPSADECFFRYERKGGYVQAVKAGTAGLKHLRFSILTLKKGENYKALSEDTEAGFVILSGRCDVKLADTVWTDLGEREDVFSGRATAVYIPPKVKYEVRAKENLEVAICEASAGEVRSEPKLIRPRDVQTRSVGIDNWKREIHDIIVDNVPAQRLLVGETFNPPGSWSSYPPHKHDQDIPGRESKLEEIYFYKIQPEDGFGIQRIYDKRGTDKLYLFRNNTGLLFTRGYHPLVIAPGYRLYYLWMLAGNNRAIQVSIDPEYQWILDAIPDKGKRRPR